jgi:hypothetical protein
VSEDAYFGTVDLTDFYLGTPNPNPPYLKVFLDQYPSEVLSSLSSLPFARLHWSPKGPARAERKVRGWPSSSRFNTGVDLDDVDGSTGVVVSNHVGVCGAGAGRGEQGYAAGNAATARAQTR